METANYPQQKKKEEKYKYLCTIFIRIHFEFIHPPISND